MTDGTLPCRWRGTHCHFVLLCFCARSGSGNDDDKSVAGRPVPTARSTGRTPFAAISAPQDSNSVRAATKWLFESGIGTRRCGSGDHRESPGKQMRDAVGSASRCWCRSVDLEAALASTAARAHASGAQSPPFDPSVGADEGKREPGALLPCAVHGGTGSHCLDQLKELISPQRTVRDDAIPVNGKSAATASI